MKGRNTGFAFAGVVVLLILILLGRYALREIPPEPTTAQTEAAKPELQRRARSTSPHAELTDETPASQLEESAVTNAATLYRLAFALYDALSKEEKALLTSWPTNINATVEAELCNKIRPICDIMHQAVAVTNCDWGVEPLTLETPLRFLTSARNLARTAAWSAAHCHSNDPTLAAEDVLSTLQLGQHVSQVAIIGCLVDIAIQGISFYSMASNLNSFRGEDAQRLAAAIADSSYAQAPARAMEQEAAMLDRRVAEWASLSPDEFKNIEFNGMDGPLEIDQAAALAVLQQIADSERQLAKALASGSEAEYQAWLRESDELQQSNSLAKLFLAGYDRFVDKVQRATITREMTIAALAVVDAGTDALMSHPDPATGQPFVYTPTADGFELQSGYQLTNGVPLKMQFK
ncbi:MAG TPA: hypothetical protein VLZ12_12970 [Verrucomicrobiae bacterium]|nr:hypothetical protein [Verrucomicrobiae bacterium]